jgi:hypothetical protein
MIHPRVGVAWAIMSEKNGRDVSNILMLAPYKIHYLPLLRNEKSSQNYMRMCNGSPLREKLSPPGTV